MPGSSSKEGAQPSVSGPGKRKSLSTSSSDGESDAEMESFSQKLTATGKISASQQLVPVPGNPDAPLVTKRTLQNRKAQREFRKRREARVKDLEERVRRYDEQGIEANMALQQIAESLKRENEALKGLVVRLGFGNMISSTLEGLAGPSTSSFQSHQPSYPALDISMASWAKDTSAPSGPQMGRITSSGPTRSKGSKSSATSKARQQQQQQQQQQSSGLTTQPQFDPSTADSVNPSLLNESSRPSKKDDEVSPFDSDWFAQLAQTGHGKDAEDEDGAANGKAQATAPKSGAGFDSTLPRNESGSTVNPILSLSFNANDGKNGTGQQQQQQQQQNGKEREEQQQRSQPLRSFKLGSRPGEVTPNTALRNFFNEFNGSQSGYGQDGNNGSGGSSSSNNNNGHSNGSSGSAMLGTSSTGRDFGMPGMAIPMTSNPLGGGGGANLFPMPLPTHQNDALLNPNPIPFAFSLSNTRSPPDQSWWNQMGGGQFTDGDASILDEKAQAVAQATAGQGNGAQSPFDLSAFLTGGITPGGGFNLGPHAAPGNADPALGQLAGADDPLGKVKDEKDAEDEKKPSTVDVTSATNDAKRQLTPAEHAQMFLRLLEAKTAKQSGTSYTSLGFQPPSQLMRQRVARASASDDARSSPSTDGDAPSGDAPQPLKLELPSSSPSLSPTNVYSRLSQHPAFLSTDASELEELVESIGANQGQQLQKKLGNGTLLYPASTGGLTPSLYGPPSAAAGKPMARQVSGAEGSDGVEVDEKALDKMLGFLDKKSPRAATMTFTSTGFSF